MLSVFSHSLNLLAVLHDNVDTITSCWQFHALFERYKEERVGV